MTPLAGSKWRYALFLALLLGITLWNVGRADDPAPRVDEGGVLVIDPDSNTEGTGRMVAPAEVVPQTPSGYATYVRRYAGLTFVPRDSDQEHNYSGSGCIEGKVGGTGLWVHSLDLPQGAEITDFRLYYYDSNGSAAVNGWITRFDNAGITEDLISVPSSDAGGYGSVAAPTSILVDNTSFSYVVYGRPGGNDGTTRLCGVAVTYRLDLNNLRLPLIYGGE